MDRVPAPCACGQCHRWMGGRAAGPCNFLVWRPTHRNGHVEIAWIDVVQKSHYTRVPNTGQIKSTPVGRPSDTTDPIQTLFILKFTTRSAFSDCSRQVLT